MPILVDRCLQTSASSSPLSAVDGGNPPLEPRRMRAAALASRMVHANDARCRSRARTELCAQRTPSSCYGLYKDRRTFADTLHWPYPSKSHSSPCRRSVVWTARRTDGQVGWTTMKPLTTDLTTVLSAT